MIAAANLELTAALRQLVDDYPRQAQWEVKVAARTSPRVSSIVRPSEVTSAAETAGGTEHEEQ
jgi:hypothetical protein